ncbi:mandelate racemase/muconate lactonizing enzyme family protein [Sediminicurvatus halobius]|uniref:Mandelate racemase/muconate lactonizing enzyme family protein n=1 Tax=Sediminicurvatus halobius TaxID=2182432 RepID=A0A2U2N9Q5_9GAMM|nr:mandelate racemase/muconate lactonizing enzyme family protein [Spiribacter halobius]PWG65827.1 mandelate racemase/muconate lactonizing enzyme family protein [Spiribacter halobius]UEX77871.1 mandelate racemase/muconate lactonizing enzyme family protein [Spiribacter halobius]
MKIKDIRASLHTTSIEIPLLEGRVSGYGREEQKLFVVCEVETDEGITGIGLTGHFLAHSVVAALEKHFLPVVRDMDPRDLEAIHQRVFAKLNPRAMTGTVSMALSCLDIALWDIQGKHAGRSVAQLLGAARDHAPAYVTFGFPQYDREQLAEAARLHVRNGFSALKSVVAVDKGGWREDAARVRVIREAVGDDVDIMIDANYLFNPVEAKMLCRAIEDCNITWFEEPLQQNDARALADLRRSTRIPLAAGQMEGHRWRLRELVEKQAVDILQPNVTYCGGYTEARKAAHLAQTYNMPIANGGGWPLFNMHMMAGLMNGWIVEWHLGMVSVGESIFVDPPRPENGVIRIPDAPGLGLTVDRDGLKETRVEG